MARIFWMAAFICIGLWQSNGWCIKKSIVRMGETIVIEKDVQVRDVVTIGGDIYVEGVVDGDAVAVGGSLILDSGAVINGDAVAVGGEIKQAENVTIEGDVVEVTAPGLMPFLKDIPDAFWHGLFWGLRIYIFIGILAFVVLITALFPKHVQVLADTTEKQPAKSLLWGLIGVIAIAPVAFLLTVSVIGIILVPVEIILVILMFFVGYVGIALFIGRKLIAALHVENLALLWQVVIGFAILWLVGWIPIIGPIFRALTSLYGFGIVITALIQHRASGKKQTTPEPAS